MIRNLIVAAIVLILVAACGEATPTRWPTVTPASTGASEAKPTEAPNDPSGTAATPVPAGTSRDSGAADPVGASSGERTSGVESKEDVVVTESGLRIKDIVAGTGEQAREGAIVAVHYTGWLLDGTKFDSSVDRGMPFEFQLGARRVIKGWDEGVATMRVGGKRELTIPPDLAYGERGAGALIKPGDTLVFEIELLEVKDP